MAINIRQPDITASDPQEAVKQMRSYLYQLAQTLNWAFGTLEKAPVDLPGGVTIDGVPLDEYIRNINKGG